MRTGSVLDLLIGVILMAMTMGAGLVAAHGILLFSRAYEHRQTNGSGVLDALLYAFETGLGPALSSIIIRTSDSISKLSKLAICRVWMIAAICAGLRA